MPVLRFPEFEGEWEKKELGEICRITSGGTPNRGNSEYWGGDIPWISTSLINFNAILQAEEFITHKGLENSSAKLFPKGTLLMAMYGQGKTRGQVAILEIEAATNQACAAIIPDNKIITERFVLHNLIGRYQEIRNLSNQGGQENLSGGLIKGIEISIPTLPEQQKIATFLSAVDSKLSQLKKKKSLLEQYKKGVMQQIFSQHIRFKQDDGSEFPDWEEKQLNEFLFESKARNKDLKYSKNDVLSVSGEFGIVNQIEFQGRSFAGVSVALYHEVKTGEIVYTKSPLKSNPYGIIKVNKGVPGIVSTLYAVYTCKENASGEYLDYYFYLNENTNRYLRPLVRKGAKNDMKINNEYVLSDSISIPTIDEQLKIVDFISAIDNKINHCGKQIEKMELWKKGLLQQMFV